jgi:uncharacterized membrane protein
MSHHKGPKKLAQRGFRPQITQQFQSKFYSGPIPAPEQLEHYEKVQAGLAERIVTMAEKQIAIAEGQTKHRQDLERTVIHNNVRLSYLGLVSGFILGAAGLGSAIWLIYIGRQLGGGAAFVTSLSALVGLFFYGKRKQSTELEKKRSQ